MLNYYEVLRVDYEAGTNEIKSSFRRLLKQYHPDHNEGNRAWAEERTRRLVEAYHVLSDDRRRSFHDQQLRVRSRPRAPDARVEPRQPINAEAVLCRRILEDLLGGDGQRAIRTYEMIRGDQQSFDFYPYLSLKDHLDCKFLLGEEYERQGSLREALALYEEVYEEEFEGPRIRYFFDEVYDRIVRIYCHQIARQAEVEEAIECFRHALGLRLVPKDQAEIHKRFAESLLKVGDKAAARSHLSEAVRLRPGLKGVQRLCARLGIEPAAL